MRVRFLHRSLFAVMVATSLVVTPSADTKLSKAQADVFSKKVGTIAGSPPKKGATRRTPVSESEINSWMTYSAQPLLPKGVAEPSVAIVGNGKISGRAIVDLDQVSKQKSQGGGLTPWRLLGGRVPLTVNGTLTSKDGVGQFQLESAQVSSIPVPKFLLQELLAYYSKSPGHPDGLSLEEPFELPANIRQIEVGQGQAVIVQ